MISFTVDVEEVYQDLWPGADEKILRYYGNRLPQGTFIDPLRDILEIFKKYHVYSTFFISGEVGKSFPDTVQEIYDDGHEIASHGYVHKDFTRLPSEELVKREMDYLNLLTKITGDTPKGFRAPLWKIDCKTIDLLERVGYRYDSSVVPSIKIPRWFGYYNAPFHPYRLRSNVQEFFEVPIAVFPYLRLPAGIGWSLRNFGLWYMKATIRLLLRKKLPVILCVHPMDVDPNVPILDGVAFHVTRRCGPYALKAIEHIVGSFECRKVAIQNILEELYDVAV